MNRGTGTGPDPLFRPPDLNVTRRIPIRLPGDPPANADPPMRLPILLFMWITPALVAGALGWTGIWGGSSAAVDYLIPIPVAGGAFHVPSFVFAATVLATLGKWPESFARFIPLLAGAVFLAALALLLDFERLNAWLFTDYDPGRSPFRLGKNPLLLFIASDAAWVALYALFAGGALRPAYYLLLPLVPAAIIGTQAVVYQTTGPAFKSGYTRTIDKHGNTATLVYTSATYDETLFRQWWEQDNTITRPWNTPNSQHLAVLFTRSMQDVRYFNYDNRENIVATFCVYEENPPLEAHAGYHDCFKGRVSFRENYGRSLDTTSTGLGREVDTWFAGARLCAGVAIPETGSPGNELIDLCHGLKANHAVLLERLSRQYGDDSRQVAFVQERGYLLGK